jgi:hypothetical protein
MVKEFQISVYGELKKYNEVISKARCRIFYKYGNRNGTYITEEFANKLLSTIPYTPIKGIYKEEDFTDHGEERSQGNIYGIVPENPNIQWEKNVDVDGIEREYACCDVLLFTGIYKEAGDIVSKAQSMELYEPSIKGDWELIDGQKYYVFQDACFLGLQVLGKNVEPCFEGAAFFTMFNSLKEIVNKFNTGGKLMPKLTYKLSDDDKYRKLTELLNPKPVEGEDEEGDDHGPKDWDYVCMICQVYDDYAVVRNLTDDTFDRVYYTKDDANDTITIDRRERCYIVDVNESEKNILDTLEKNNGGTFEKINQTIEDLNQKNTELQSKVDAFTKEKATLEEENTSLKTFKKEVENKDKIEIINKYSKNLTDEVISTYKEKIDSYAINDLEKELAFELVKNTPSVFTNSGSGKIPKDGPESGIESLLDKYEDKK